MGSFIRALNKAGIDQTADLNSPFAPAACTGSTDHIVDKCSDRDSTYRAFLSPKLTQQRKAHLKICTNTLVTQIALVEKGDVVRATGVHFEANDSRQAVHRYFAQARREIILCAGALASPQILMLRYFELFVLLSSTLTISQWSRSERAFTVEGHPRCSRHARHWKSPGLSQFYSSFISSPADSS